LKLVLVLVLLVLVLVLVLRAVLVLVLVVRGSRARRISILSPLFSPDEQRRTKTHKDTGQLSRWR
jgi:hypothetical protein